MENELSKLDEQKLFDDFLATLPSYSYLTSILGHIRPAVFTAMRLDLGYVDFNPHSLWRDSAELAKTIAAQNKQRAELGREIDDKRRQLAALCREFETIGGDALTIGRTAAERAAAISKALA